LAATTNRLSKFSLKNYAAPSQVPPTQQQQQQQNTQGPTAPEPPKETTPAMQTAEPKRVVVANAQPLMIAGQPATSVVGGHPAYGNGGGFDAPVNYRDGGLSNPGHSDLLYKAFVARWCFAESPPPGVGGVTGRGTEVSVGGTI
jgi:hypothetical protein